MEKAPATLRRRRFQPRHGKTPTPMGVGVPDTANARATAGAAAGTSPAPAAGRRGLPAWPTGRRAPSSDSIIRRRRRGWSASCLPACEEEHFLRPQDKPALAERL